MQNKQPTSQAHMEASPPLMTAKGTWAVKPTDKAQVLAETARNNNEGIPAWKGEVIWGDEEIAGPWADTFSVKRRRTKSIFEELKPDTATAEDQTPVRVLKKCMTAFTPWITSLVYECWLQGKWPWENPLASPHTQTRDTS